MRSCPERLSRSAALLGAAAVSRLQGACVCVVGVGGVGSWCAEALVRTGVGRLTIIDDDLVAGSNVNRQSPATMASVGRLKVDAMAERLREIAPEAEIEPLARRYAGAGDLALGRFDAVVDAIDSVACKAELILAATAAGVPLFSSMGAALRLDPARVRLTRFEKVEGDALARALRLRFRRLGRFPGRFEAAWSDEAPQPAMGVERGSVMTVTASFGLALAAAVMRRLCDGG